MTEIAPNDHRTPGFGVAATCLGGAALLGAVVTLFGGPFAPQADAAVSLGELAAQAGKAALRDMVGMDQPPRAPVAWDVDRILWVAMAALGALAVILAAISVVRHEPWRWAAAGATLGAGAVVFQYAVAVVAAMLIVLLVAAVFQNFGV